MISSLQRRLITFVVAIVSSLPHTAQAQPPTQSFDALSQILEVGQKIVVTDVGGSRTEGKIADLSSASLTVVTPKDDGALTRVFDERTVVEIKEIDSLLNGAAIGALVGAGLGLWDYLIDPSEPGNAAFFAVAIGLGSLIGTGIDAMHGGKVLYVRPQQRLSLALAENDRERALVIVGGSFGWSKGPLGANTTAPGVMVGAFLNRHVSVSAEAVWPRQSTSAYTETSEIVPLNRRGSQYLRGAVPVLYSVQSRTPYSVSGLVGYHPPSWHRVHLALLGGLTFHRVAASSSWQEPVATGPTTYEMELRQSSDSGMPMVATFGVDARIPVLRQLAVVPQARIGLGAIRAGLGLQWAF